MDNDKVKDVKRMVVDKLGEHGTNILIWSLFIISSILVYVFVSSGDFSFTLTFASFMRCFGFLLLNYKIWMGRSVKGVSAKTIQLYLVVFLTRLLSILRHQGYLPFDRSGDWFYHMVEILSFISIVGVLFGIYGPLNPTYDEKFDKFGNLHVPNELGGLYLLGPAVLLAILVHPSLNHEAFSDICWTISMYLECVAMLPQLYMFQRQASSEGNTVERMLGHMVFALGFSRVFEFLFWVTSFKELSHHTGSRLVGWIILFMQVAHMMIMGDFFYYYFLSLASGKPMELPTVSYLDPNV